MVIKKPRQRNMAVDILRAVSILLMIVLHINPIFPKLYFTGWVWSWGQWVVPAFILCSIAVDTSDIRNASDYLRYLWKRGIRLLIPYYIWLFTYLSLMVLVGHKTITGDMILKNLTFTGGSDFNWMILLFIYITLALPFLRKLVDKSESASLVVLLLSMTTSALYLSNRSYWNSSYRWWMVIPWYGITVGILLFLKWWRTKRWGHIAAFFTTNIGIFVYWYLYLQNYNITTHTYYHKYPPDLYYFTFSLWTVMLVYVLVSLNVHRMQKFDVVMRFLTYVSTRSYAIFFVHILVLYVLDAGFPRRPFNYIVFSTLVFVPTFILTKGIDYLLKYKHHVLHYMTRQVSRN